MDFLKALKNSFKKYNIEYINIIPFEYEGFNSIVVALLPYYTGEEKSYFSKYTRGYDYHKMGREIFKAVFKDSNISEYKIYVDVSPFNERELALKAGLGIKGNNGLVINEKYGSYVFIATALINTNNNYEVSDFKDCISCGKCMLSCPGKAISKDFINYDKCLSFLTQKKNLLPEEKELIKKNNSAWGCDICQDVCPLNKDKKITPIDKFKKNLLLEMNDLDSLSNKEFSSKYKDYALSYKGKNILKRNIKLIKEK